ncbi:MAG: protein kinase [Cyanosarcina radialis HA8281-LM2]|jgi:serine/threonine-protein kinase|nr:protein kinase [Cyanosarcina radialis HA8281-LM2]
MIGQLLGGHYRIVKSLGKGGFGETYLAVDLHLPDRPQRVVKQLKPQSNNPLVLETAKKLFDREAQVLYELGSHDRIPSLFAHFEEDEQFFLVEEFVPGHDLSYEIAVGKQLSESQVIFLLRDIAEVLAFVHQNRVIHRDIKPSNLIRRQADGKIVLIDFGAVKQVSTQIVDTGGLVTTSTVAIGTQNYMPSEQRQGNPQFSSDVYALGMLCIQALTGVEPSKLPLEPNSLEIIWRDRPGLPSETQLQVDPKLADILDQMVLYDFRKRYGSAAEVLQAIDSLTAAPEPPGTSAVGVKPDRSLKWNPKIVLPLVLLGGAIAILFGATKLVFQPDIPVSPYENTQYGIKLNYPQNWDKQENANIITKEVVTLVSPRASDSDKFLETVSVTVEDLPSPKSLEEYTSFAKQEIQQNNQDVQIQSEGEDTLAGNKAYRIIYTRSDGEVKLKTMAIWTLKNFKAYAVIYEAELGEYDRFLNEAEKIIKSLQVQSN